MTGPTAPGKKSGIERHIEEMETSIVNTRKFLECIHRSEIDNKRYVEQLKESLEGNLTNLKRKRDLAAGDLSG